MRYGAGSPDAVKQWSLAEFDEALIIWQGEAEYKVTEDEINDDLKERRALNRGFLLDRDQTFWGRFITEDGGLDTEKVLAKGYSEEQIPYIQGEMIKLGWLTDDEDTLPDED